MKAFIILKLPFLLPETERSSFVDLIGSELHKCLIAEDRWIFYIQGFGSTIFMALLACLIGILLGLVIAIVRVSHRNTGKLRGLNALCGLYLTVIRGTPVLVQLLIVYYVIFATAPLDKALLIASLAFGLNSAAYVAEVIRAGIQSVEKGQSEAGRSLGLNDRQTMRLIILPQAIKNILPALFNEFITLLKETSVAGYISIVDLTKAGDIVRSRAWTFTPLLITAVVYLVLVVGLTRLQRMLDRKMSAGDQRPPAAGRRKKTLPPGKIEDDSFDSSDFRKEGAYD